MEKKVTRVSPAARTDTISYENAGTPSHNKSMISLHYNEEAVDAEVVGAAPVVRYGPVALSDIVK